MQQGDVAAKAKQAVLWIDRHGAEGEEPSRVLAYLEGDATVDFGRRGDKHPATGKAAQSIHDHTWFGRFHTLDEVRVRVAFVAGEPSSKPELWRNAMAALEAGGEWPVKPAQFSIPDRPTPPRTAPRAAPRTRAGTPAAAGRTGARPTAVPGLPAGSARRRPSSRRRGAGGAGARRGDCKDRIPQRFAVRFSHVQRT